MVEARDAVIWSKPDDLPFGEKLPPLGAEGVERFAALFFDGHVATIPLKIDPITLRALITVDGGEAVDTSFDDSRRQPRGVSPVGRKVDRGGQERRFADSAERA